MEDAKERGIRIRRMRKALDMRQVDLAELLGVDQSTVSDMENGSDFGVELLARLAQVLESTPTYVLTGEDESAWPFASVEMVDFAALEEKQRGIVEGKLAAAIEQFRSKEDSLRELETHSPRRTTIRKGRKAA